MDFEVDDLQYTPSSDYSIGNPYFTSNDTVLNLGIDEFDTIELVMNITSEKSGQFLLVLKNDYINFLNKTSGRYEVHLSININMTLWVEQAAGKTSGRGVVFLNNINFTIGVAHIQIPKTNEPSSIPLDPLQ